MHTSWEQENFTIPVHNGYSQNARKNIVQTQHNIATTFNRTAEVVNSHTNRLDNLASSAKDLQTQMTTEVEARTKFQQDTTPALKRHTAKIQTLEAANILQQTGQAVLQQKVANTEGDVAQLKKQLAVEQERIVSLQKETLPINKSVKQLEAKLEQEKARNAQLELQIKAQSKVLEENERECEKLSTSFTDLCSIVKQLDEQFQAFRDLTRDKEAENLLTIEGLKKKCAELTLEQKSDRLSGEFLPTQDSSKGASQRIASFEKRRAVKKLSRTTSEDILPKCFSSKYSSSKSKDKK